jgi:hypothetical protein
MVKNESIDDFLGEKSEILSSIIKEAEKTKEYIDRARGIDNEVLKEKAIGEYDMLLKKIDELRTGYEKANTQ